jgi:cell division septation protein DedD
MPNPFTSPSANPLANRLAQGYVADLYRAAIGLRSQDYYLNHFLKFDADGKTSATWNWAAYWATLNWLIYRRLYGPAMAYGSVLAAGALAIFGVGKLAFNYSDGTGLLLFFLFMSLAFVMPGIYANAVFYKHCNDRISQVLQETPDVPSACEVLQAQASDGKRAFKMGLANLAVLSLCAGLTAFMLQSPGAGSQIAQGTQSAQSARSKPAAGPMTLGMLPVTNTAPNATANTPSTQSAAAPGASPPSALPAPGSKPLPLSQNPFPTPALALTNADTASRADTAVRAEAAKSETLTKADAAAKASPQSLPENAASPPARSTKPMPETLPEPVPARMTSPAKIEALAMQALQPATAQEKPASSVAQDKPARDMVLAQAKVAEPAAPTTPAKPDKPLVAEGKAAKVVEPALAKPKASSDAALPASASEAAAARTAQEKTGAKAETKPAAATKLAVADGGKPKRVWFVQAGAFAQAGNAQNVSSRLDEAGFKSIIEPLSTATAQLTRVRVGPYETKADAEKAVQQIKALDLPAVLFRE